MVRHKFSALVLVRKTPQVRRLHMRVFQAVTETIVLFQLEKDSRDRPVRPVEKLLHAQSVSYALFPCKWRRARTRSTGRNLHRSLRKRITVVKVLLKI